MENHLNTWKLTCRILGRLRKILEISSAIYWPTTLWWIHLSLIDFDMSVLHQNWMFSCSGSDFWTIQNIWLLELYKCCFQFQSHVWWPNLPCFVNGQPFFSSRRRGKGPCGRGCRPVSWSKAHWVPFKKMDDMFLVDFWWHTWVFCWKNQCSPRVLHVFSMKFPREWFMSQSSCDHTPLPCEVLADRPTERRGTLHLERASVHRDAWFEPLTTSNCHCDDDDDYYYLFVFYLLLLHYYYMMISYYSYYSYYYVY